MYSANGNHMRTRTLEINRSQIEYAQVLTRDDLYSAAYSAAETVAKITGETAEKTGVDPTAHIVPTMIGAMAYTMMVVEHLGESFPEVDVKLDAVRVAMYGADTKRSATLRVVADPRDPINGIEGDVFFGEDIADSLNTINFLGRWGKPNASIAKPAGRYLLTMLNKPDAQRIQLEDELFNGVHVGYHIPDVWAVGGGMDAGDRYRQLPGIWFPRTAVEECVVSGRALAVAGEYYSGASFALR